MYAGYARVADDITALRHQVVNGFGIVVMVFVPLSVGLAVTADLITPLCLGPKWAGAAPLIAISALWALFDNIGYFANNLYIIRQAQARFADAIRLANEGFTELIPLSAWVRDTVVSMTGSVDIRNSLRSLMSPRSAITPTGTSEVKLNVP